MGNSPLVPARPEKKAAAGCDPAARTGFLLQDVSAWVLRLGVAASVVVMLVGLGLSFSHQPPTLQHMLEKSSYNPGVVWHGIWQGHGEDIIDAGIFILVLTPVIRVATCAVLFVVGERDWFYGLVAVVVLLLLVLALVVLS